MNSLILVLGIFCSLVYAEPPKNFYNGLPPPPPAKQQLPPLSQNYGPPKQTYGPPPPAQEYGPPAQEYGPPTPEKIITKNVYVHVPPEDNSQQLQAPIPKKHYKIVFIKAPTEAPIPVQQDEHKTLVYLLVKKQPEIEVPTTEPSKPEVYFIKYKQSEKELEPKYGPPSF